MSGTVSITIVSLFASGMYCVLVCAGARCLLLRRNFIMRSALFCPPAALISSIVSA